MASDTGCVAEEALGVRLQDDLAAAKRLASRGWAAGDPCGHLLGVSAGVGVGAAHLLSWLRRQDKHDAEAVWIMIGSYTTDGPRYRWPGGW